MFGAYGLTVDAPFADPMRSGLLRVAEADDWPTLCLGRQALRGAEPAGRVVTSEQVAVRLADGGYLRMSRARACATFATPVPLGDDELVHPYLGLVAGFFARWQSYEPFHSGAVVVDGGAWGLLGPKGAGKSTLNAALAVAGYELLADDLLVVDPRRPEGPVSFAGPRCIDLRPDVGPRIDDSFPMRSVRGGERWRFTLGPVRALERPLRGFVVLEEGRRVEVRRLPVTDRLHVLARNQMVRNLPHDESAYLNLIELPMLVLQRPTEWSALDETVSALIGALTAASSDED